MVQSVWATERTLSVPLAAVMFAVVLGAVGGHTVVPDDLA